MKGLIVVTLLMGVALLARAQEVPSPEPELPPASGLPSNEAVDEGVAVYVAESEAIPVEPPTELPMDVVAQPVLEPPLPLLPTQPSGGSGDDQPSAVQPPIDAASKPSPSNDELSSVAEEKPAVEKLEDFGPPAQEEVQQKEPEITQQEVDEVKIIELRVPLNDENDNEEEEVEEITQQEVPLKQQQQEEEEEVEKITQQEVPSKEEEIAKQEMPLKEETITQRKVIAELVPTIVTPEDPQPPSLAADAELEDGNRVQPAIMPIVEELTTAAPLPTPVSRPIAIKAVTAKQSRTVVPEVKEKVQSSSSPRENEDGAEDLQKPIYVDIVEQHKHTAPTTAPASRPKVVFNQPTFNPKVLNPYMASLHSYGNRDHDDYESEKEKRHRPRDLPETTPAAFTTAEPAMEEPVEAKNDTTKRDATGAGDQQQHGHHETSAAKTIGALFEATFLGVLGALALC